MCVGTIALDQQPTSVLIADLQRTLDELRSAAEAARDTALVAHPLEHLLRLGDELFERFGEIGADGHIVAEEAGHA
jgi:hypothetical protein